MSNIKYLVSFTFDVVGKHTPISGVFFTYKKALLFVKAIQESYTISDAKIYLLNFNSNTISLKKEL